MLNENPFTPTFGEVPAYMAGREALLNDLKRAFSAKRRHPNLTTVITGARGTGKTALLSQASDEAEARGWISVKTVALPGMLEDILITSRRRAFHLLNAKGEKKLSGIEFGQLIGIEWENAPQQTNWRNQMTDLLEQMEKTDTGLLIVVDEVQPKLPEMIELAAVYQLFVMEGRKVALLMAGLPHNMTMLEADKTVSFLRRAQRVQLSRIPDFEIEEAMRRTVEGSSRSITSEALRETVSASDGFPFMMQLVGFRVWDQHPDCKQITKEDASAGIALAKKEFAERIVKATYDSLSGGDRAFLEAMVLEGSPSNVVSISRRMGKSHSYATQYKNRLLGQGVIEETSAGLVFQLPLMSEYVRQQRGC